MDLNLKGKTVLVTGGASGIGEAIVRGLAAEEAVPVIADRNGAAATLLLRELRDSGARAESVTVDLSTPEACRSVIAEVVERTGTLYGLVNNAGDNDGAGLEHGTPETFRNSLVKNLHHCFDLAHYALPHLKESRGAIVNISSKTAVTGQGGTSGYVAAKSAQLGLTREWAVELLPWKVRVNAVLPAEVITPHYRTWLKRDPDPERKKRLVEKKIPLENRFTKPEEIADTVLFLLSDRASHITGQYLHVDGGYVHLDRSLAPAESGGCGANHGPKTDLHDE